MQLLVFTLSLLQVNADEYCDNFVQEYNTFKTRCSTDNITLTSCCGLQIFSPPSGIYMLKREAFGTTNTYFNMNTRPLHGEDGLLYRGIGRAVQKTSTGTGKIMKEDLEILLQNFGMDLRKCIV